MPTVCPGNTTTAVITSTVAAMARTKASQPRGRGRGRGLKRPARALEALETEAAVEEAAEVEVSNVTAEASDRKEVEEKQVKETKQEMKSQPEELQVPEVPPVAEIETQETQETAEKPPSEPNTDTSDSERSDTLESDTSDTTSSPSYLMDNDSGVYFTLQQGSRRCSVRAFQWPSKFLWLRRLPGHFDKRVVGHGFLALASRRLVYVFSSGSRVKTQNCPEFLYGFLLSRPLKMDILLQTLNKSIGYLKAHVGY